MAAPDPDAVDALVDQWRVARPDLAGDLGAMAVFGRLGRFSALATASIEAVLGAHGLSVADFDVLAALRRSGEPYELKPSTLARSLMLSPAGITSRLDRLERAGLVTRRMDPEDRRSFLVALNDQGLETVDAAVADHVANEARLLAVLDPKRLAALDDALRRLLAQFPRD